jgi:hypothetical protein
MAIEKVKAYFREHGMRKGFRNLMSPVQQWSLPPKHYTVSLRG